jgi:hypothetical protein
MSSDQESDELRDEKARAKRIRIFQAEKELADAKARGASFAEIAELEEKYKKVKDEIL